MMQVIYIKKDKQMMFIVMYMQNSLVKENRFWRFTKSTIDMKKKMFYINKMLTYVYHFKSSLNKVILILFSLCYINNRIKESFWKK